LPMANKENHGGLWSDGSQFTACSFIHASMRIPLDSAVESQHSVLIVARLSAFGSMVTLHPYFPPANPAMTASFLRPSGSCRLAARIEDQLQQGREEWMASHPSLAMSGTRARPRSGLPTAREKSGLPTVLPKRSATSTHKEQIRLHRSQRRTCNLSCQLPLLTCQPRIRWLPQSTG